MPTLTLLVSACGGGGGGGGGGGNLPDGGGSVRGCPMNFAGCTSFDDERSAAQPIFVAFQEGDGPTVYTPKCILITAGESIVLPAGSANPLENASCTPADSPIPTTPAESSMEYTFANAGNYGFQSATMGFQGLIVVQ